MRRYGIDVSHFQDPAAPAGNSWSTLSESSSFAIVRATYGGWPDPAAPAHVQAARIEAMQVGLYHFLCVQQSVVQQMDHFAAQAIACGIGKGDILPALDVEDDGPNRLSPAFQAPVRQALDILVSEFGGAMVYCTQAGWIQMGKPAWMLEYSLWVPHYLQGNPATNHPATPGGKAPDVWQYRVGPYRQGVPFVPGDEKKPNAIDHNIADAPLPLSTSSPSEPGTLAPHTEPPALPPWAQRMDALTNALRAGLDLNADKDHL